MKYKKLKVPAYYDRAKTQLLFSNPFFSALMLQCQHIWDTSHVPTAGTDGKNLYFNPNYCATLTEQEFQGLLVHELLHKIFLHHIRAYKYKDVPDNLEKWNRACDYAINPIVLEARFILPPGALIDDQYKGMTAEQIYDLLPDTPTQPAENHFVFTDKPLTDKDAREIKVQVAAAANTAKNAGELPGALKNLIEENARTVIDWKAALADFMEVNLGGDDDITFKRPNRRMLVHDMYLPAYESTQTGPVCIMYDTSGSIYGDPEAMASFNAEIRSLVEHTQPEAVHIICNDTQVQSHEIFSPDEELDLRLVGGGGTDFDQAFEYLHALDEYPPRVNLVFTDLYFRHEHLQSDIPTLWITYGDDVNVSLPPFGTVLHVPSSS